MMVNVASLVNSILADDGYNGLSDDTKSKFEQYLRNPTTSRNEIGTNTSSGKYFQFGIRQIENIVLN